MNYTDEDLKRILTAAGWRHFYTYEDGAEEWAGPSGSDTPNLAEIRSLVGAAIAAAAPAIRRAERERAAAVFDLMRNRSLGAQSGDPSELSNVMLRQVAELGWGQAAEAIRALPEEP